MNFGLAGCDLDALGLLGHRAGVVVRGARLPRLCRQLQLLLPMLIHLINIIVEIGVDPVLHMTRREVGRSGCQCSSREVVLSERLIMVCVRMGLLRMGMVGLRLKLGDLHAETVVGLAAIHHDMLALMGLAIHGEMIEGSCLRERRRTSRRRGVVTES